MHSQQNDGLLHESSTIVMNKTLLVGKVDAAKAIYLSGFNTKGALERCADIVHQTRPGRLMDPENMLDF